MKYLLKLIAPVVFVFSSYAAHAQVAAPATPAKPAPIKRVAKPAVKPRPKILAHKIAPKSGQESGPLVFPEPTLEVSSSDNAANIKASEILGRMDKAYHSIRSFSATFDARASNDPGKPICHAFIAFQREPERAIATITDPSPADYVYDGSHIILFPSPDSSHFTFTDNVWDNLAGSGIAAIFGRLIDDPKQDLLPRMLTSGFQTQNDLGTLVQLNLLPRIVLDGHTCDSLQAILDDGSRVLLLIGASDHMLRRATWSRLDAAGNNIYFVEQYSNIKTNPTLPASLFTFKPPPGVSLELGF
jgi:hypothetical protein